MSEEEQVYSEIIELPAVPNAPLQEIVLNPSTSSFLETQMGSFVKMNFGDPQTGYDTKRRVNAGAGTSTINRPPSYRRYSDVEDEIDLGSPTFGNSSRIGKNASTDEILSNSRGSVATEGELDIPADLLSLRTRLKIKKTKLSFLEYGVYAMVAVYEEVENILILDIAYFIFSFIVSAIGWIRLDGCRVSPNVPVVMCVSGTLDSFVNLDSFIATLTRKEEAQLCLRDIARISRFILFFIHIYCLTKVYLILPPDEENRHSPAFCDSTAFWIAFSYFHITILTSISIWIGMLVAALSFYM